MIIFLNFDYVKVSNYRNYSHVAHGAIGCGRKKKTLSYCSSATSSYPGSQPKTTYPECHVSRLTANVRVIR